MLLIGLAYTAITYNLRHSLSLRDPVFHHRLVAFEKRVQSQPRDYTVIALGSSRMHNAFLGEVVEEAARENCGRRGLAFNFSCMGGGPVTSRLYLARLLERGAKPDRVVVEVFAATMVEDCGLYFEAIATMTERMAPDEVDSLVGYGLDGEAVRRRHAQIEAAPWSGLRDQFFERFDRQLLPDGAVVKSSRDFDAWGGRPVTFGLAPLQRREQRRQTMAAVYAPVLAREELLEGSCRALEDLVVLCRDNGIAVTIVLLPEAPSFRALYSPRLVENIRAELGRMAAEHGASVVDAREWLDDDDFEDGHHLYKHGAVKFTRRLCDEHLTNALAGK